MSSPVDPTQSSGGGESLSGNSPVSQELLNQLLLFSLSFGNDDATELSQDVQKMVQEIKNILPQLPKGEADEISKRLNNLPSMGSKDSAAEMKEDFTSIAGEIAQAIPNGLSEKDKIEIQTMLKDKPQRGDKDYGVEVAKWSSVVLGTIAMDLPGLLSSKAKTELQTILNTPLDPSSKAYSMKMVQHSAKIQAFFIQNLPSSVSPAEKKKIEDIANEMENVDLDRKNAPNELAALSLELQKEIGDSFF